MLESKKHKVGRFHWSYRAPHEFRWGLVWTVLLMAHSSVN